jgi:hypothetical protein
VPSKFWAEALRTATYLLNIRPSKTNPKTTPFYSLFLCNPNYTELHVFGCLCFPNVYVTSPKKLSPCSLTCVSLGYSDEHKGYRCLDLLSGCMHISRLITFDEYVYLFASRSPPTNIATSSSLLSLPRRAQTSRHHALVLPPPPAAKPFVVTDLLIQSSAVAEQPTPPPTLAATSVAAAPSTIYSYHHTTQLSN